MAIREESSGVFIYDGEGDVPDGYYFKDDEGELNGPFEDFLQAVHMRKNYLRENL